MSTTLLQNKETVRSRFLSGKTIIISTLIFIAALFVIEKSNAQCAGTALEFNGSSDYINCGSQGALKVDSALTMEAWIYPTGPGSGIYSYEDYCGMILNKDGEYEIARFCDGTIAFAIDVSSIGWYWWNTNFVAPENVWTHIALTYSSVSGHLYVYANGDSIFHLAATAGSLIRDAVPDANDLYIANRPLPLWQYFQGIIDEVRIWDFALTQSTIQQWMSQSITSSHPNYGNLKGYWKFDEGSGATTADASGNGNTGTLVSSPIWILSTAPTGASTAIVSPSGSVNVCSGTTATFTANTGTGITYQWIKGSKNIAGATASSYSTNKAAAYSVKESNLFGCSSTSAKTTLNENPLPPATITPLGNLDICQTGSVVLQANAGTGLTYQWKKGNNNISGATQQTYTATQAATYKVVVTNSSGCSKTSAGVKVTKSCREENEAPDVTPAVQLSLYPNPTDDNFTIHLFLDDESIKQAKAQVMNLIGQVIYDETISVASGELKKEISFDSNSASGMYLVRVIVNDKIYSGQIVYQN